MVAGYLIGGREIGRTSIGLAGVSGRHSERRLLGEEIAVAGLGDRTGRQRVERRIPDGGVRTVEAAECVACRRVGIDQPAARRRQRRGAAAVDEIADGGNHDVGVRRRGRDRRARIDGEIVGGEDPDLAGRSERGIDRKVCIGGVEKQIDAGVEGEGRT